MKKCIICQDSNSQEDLLTPTREAKDRLWQFYKLRTFRYIQEFNSGRYKQFFDALDKIGEYATRLINRVYKPGVTNDKFRNLRFVCHRSCYKQVTDRHDVELQMKQCISNTEFKVCE